MDSYRPRRDEPARPAFEFGREGRQQQHSGDSYRPGDFSFRAQSQRAPRFDAELSDRRSARPGDSYSRRAPSNPKKGRRRGDGRGSAGERRQPFRPRQKIPVAERPLLRRGRSATPDQYEGMNGGPARFKSLNELAALEINENNAADDEPPRKKFAAEPHGDDSNKPRWSNPDPYTVLPPPEESTGVRTDVVSLIRKARSDAAKEKLSAGDDEDFISFNMDEGNDEGSESPSESSNYSSSQMTSNRNDRGRFSHLDNLHPDRYAPGVTKVMPNAESLGAPPPPPAEISAMMDNHKGPVSALHGAPLDVWPPPPSLPPPPQTKIDSQRDSRKRARNDIAERFDVIEDSTNSRSTTNRRTMVPPGFELDSAWRALGKEDPRPWCTIDHSDTENVAHRLHKEICDYYDYIKPRKWENDMRQDLVRRTAQSVRAIFGSSAELRYFGSFAAGVYLPNSDMDLVVLSRDFRERRIRAFGNKKTLYRFSNAIQNHANSVAKPGSVATIAHAKVPIVKYVDNKTGLRVDISFDNDTGVIANNTYVQWTAQFPAMPVLVTMVKQFLQMRDLNDVSTGGLGGFSTTCLVVSLLQHLPHVQSGDMTQLSNLGELFMSFLDFYGNKFNLETTGIQLSPPAYFVKHKNKLVSSKKPRPLSLCVIDPNRDDNDLTGGTRHAHMIFGCFAHAFRVLQERMAEIQFGDKSQRSGSILDPLYAGSYTGLELQRSQLKQLYAGR